MRAEKTVNLKKAKKLQRDEKTIVFFRNMTFKNVQFFAIQKKIEMEKIS